VVFLRSILVATLLFMSESAYAMSKDIQADMLMVKITGALKANKFSEALPVMAELEALGTPLSEDFQFLYIDTLDRAGERASALSRSYAYLEKYGRAGGYYGRVIEITTRLQDLADKEAPGRVFRDCADCPEMVVVPAGSFQMGSYDGDKDEQPVHEVTIRRAFAVGKFEVTQAEWQAVMGTNPSKFPGSRNPVEQVSWNDAQEFILRLNAKVRSVATVSTGGDGPYRLLTEAEWEYVARAGTTTNWSCGATEGCLSSVAVYNANSGGRTAPVGSKMANAFGLYDMHGNVWEWVQDCYADSYAGAPSDGSPAASLNSCDRVSRGGSWNFNPRFLRSAVHGRSSTGERYDNLGFRLARTLP
jgi:formylglycine-generating enzyme required for sulfatase activity